MKGQDKYAQLFAAEARDHLSEMSRGLMAIEADSAQRGSLDAVFRSVHTIKGMAAAMGYDVATRLAHNIESALDEARSGGRRVTAQLVDLLLESADLLDAVVTATVAGHEPPDADVMIERLVSWRLAVETVTPAVDPPEAGGPEAQGREAERRGGARGATTSGLRRPDAGRIRVPIGRLDTLLNLIGELKMVRDRLQALTAHVATPPLADAFEKAGQLITEMQAQVVESRMVPMWQVFDRYPRLVRESARMAGKEVELEMKGKELEVDRTLLDAIGDPLLHLLRNAVDHGIELPEEREAAGKPRVGHLKLAARRERSRVVIEISDDGRGVNRQRVREEARRRGLIAADVELDDLELYRVLAGPGFSTADQVTTLSGRGVGLNVVEESVRKLGGSVRFSTQPGVGTTFRLELPLTLVILPAVIVAVAGQVYAVPASFARESLELWDGAVETRQGEEWIRWHDERLPLRRLRRQFVDCGDEPAAGNGSKPEKLRVMVLEFGGVRSAIAVDSFVGQEEIVVKTFDMPRGAVPLFSGATVRPDGRPALVLDVGSLTRC
ncbi:MAG: chemotaxis protein CheA [Gemmatimonadales bacterium]|jgi:two-component system chemotaxis sensor kinase CheA